jgi:hypothetical protein
VNHRPLSSFERQAYRTVVDDGLIDLVMGLLLCALTVLLLFEDRPSWMNPSVFAPVLTLGAVGLWRLLRTRWVEPRVGYVRLGSERLERVRRRKRGVGVVFLVGALGLGVLMKTDATWAAGVREMKAVALALWLGLGWTVAGFLLEVRRWSLYAVVLVLGALVERAFGLPKGSGWLAAGTVVVGLALFQIWRFLEAHGGSPNGEETGG